MRIIAGKWRGRPLYAPASLQTRPTADRVREALFSMLASRLGSFNDLRVADLFAGTGALGLEALSRGAAHATFVENDREAVNAIRRNAQTLGADVDLLISSALALPHREQFDLIFADPPYERDSGNRVVESVTSSGWLGPGAWIAVETSSRHEVESTELQIDAVRTIGKAKITLLRRS